MKNNIDTKIEKIQSDIKSIRIQGATNVAYAVLEGMKIVVKAGSIPEADLSKELIRIGKMLSTARANEPLARNAVVYIQHKLSAVAETKVRETILKACDEYVELINTAKQEMVMHGEKVLQKEDVVLTHCHSSTTTNILIQVHRNKVKENKSFQVVSTETRPLYQGRKTAKELIDAGVSVTQIVDSAATAFIVDDSYLPVGAVIVGCDELLPDGSFVNKVGTFSMALAAREGRDEFYVASTLLKLNPKKNSSSLRIETRNASEVWDKAPKGLKIINPAFDLVKPEYVRGYITEAGVLKPEDIIPRTKKLYPWLMG